MLAVYEEMSCKILLMMHFINPHLDMFWVEKIRTLIDEQVECFYHPICSWNEAPEKL